MAYNERLADRIREALAEQQKVEEKKMFRGVCFMVNGKMCICVSGNEIMCRIDPALYETVLEEKKCRPMIRNGQTIKGFVYVPEEELKTAKEFNYWIVLALDFNQQAKATPKKKKNKI